MTPRTRRRAEETYPLGTIRVRKQVKDDINEYADHNEESLSITVERLVDTHPEMKRWRRQRKRAADDTTST